MNENKSNDLSMHRLRTSQEITDLKEKHKEKFDQLQLATHAYLRALPLDAWIDYTKNVNKANIPAMIKIICDFIDKYATVNEYIEFNTTFTMIRRKKAMISKPIPYEISKKKQDNSSILA